MTEAENEKEMAGGNETDGQAGIAGGSASVGQDENESGIENDDENEESDCACGTFAELGLAPKLLAALEALKFTAPTPIQAQAIPVGLEGKDIFGIAQTGTGKTLAFGLPMLQRLARQGGRGLIVLPTRELALQVEESLHRVGAAAGLRTAVLIGGASMEPQLKQLKAKPHVIVCTPGRLLDHLEQKNVDLKEVKIVVLDEADRMLDMGFMPQVRRILMATPPERQTMLFSATMPDEIAHLAARYMKDPVRVEVDRAGTPAELVDHRLYVVEKNQKNRLLEWLLTQFQGTVLVFTRTRHGASRVCRAVRRMGQSAAEIHSDRTLAQRREALDGFKSGKYRVLVATDIAARGIDVVGIELVVNYDVPEHPDDYVHRIGRTGRAGERGLAISMATPEQGDEIREIEKLAGIMLDITPLPELPPDRPGEPRWGDGRGGGRGFDRGGGRRDGRGGGRFGGGRSRGDRGGKPAGGTSSRFGHSGKSRADAGTGGGRPAAAAKDQRPGRLAPPPSGNPLANGPRGIGISDLGDLIPEIGASFFEGAMPVKSQAESGGDRGGRRRNHGRRRR